MKSYKVMLIGNRLGLNPGARFKMDVAALSESDREKHATDMRLGRVALVVENEAHN